MIHVLAGGDFHPIGARIAILRIDTRSVPWRIPASAALHIAVAVRIHRRIIPDHAGKELDSGGLRSGADRTLRATERACGRIEWRSAHVSGSAWVLRE